MADDLQTYLLLGKQAQGKAVVSLIRQVLAAPSIYTFTELLMLDAVKALEATEDAAYLTLLRLFSYGTYEQFSSSKSALPELGPAEVYKLKKLSLISLASQSHASPRHIAQIALTVLEPLICGAHASAGSRLHQRA